MNELIIFTHEGTPVTDSRDVARWTGKRHKDLMRDIRNYEAILTGADLRPFDFFIPGTYTDSKGEERPRFLITRKGCDMVANKMTGEKGVLFTAAYINRFYEYEQHITAVISELEAMKIQAQRDRAVAMKLNAQVRMFNTLMQTTKDKNLSPIAVEVFGLKAIEKVTGVDTGNYLPQTEKTYSATEAGQMLGVTAHKVGLTANLHGLKTATYGITVMDKSPHSAKEVPNFRYNAAGVSRLAELLGMARSPLEVQS